MKAQSKVRKFIFQLSALMFVPRCAACLSVLPSRREVLCQKCRERYELESKYLCTRCSRAHRYCTCRVEYEGRKFPLVHLTAYDIKRESVSKSVILNLKDTRFDEAFKFWAQEMAKVLNERYFRLFEKRNVIITYVPRSNKAKRKAGHDQSCEIAKNLSNITGAPMIDVFKNESEAAQKSLSKDSRKENASKNYKLLDPHVRLDGRVVIIIDDIVTTGASIGACALLAKNAHAKAVFAVVCARAENPKGLSENSYYII